MSDWSFSIQERIFLAKKPRGYGLLCLALIRSDIVKTIRIPLSIINNSLNQAIRDS